jgi:hypothetical protein
MTTGPGIVRSRQRVQTSLDQLDRTISDSEAPWFRIVAAIALLEDVAALLRELTAPEVVRITRRRTP